ncbi:MAG: hypothetical protein ACUVX9_13380 [Anaerolineae bacterium]
MADLLNDAQRSSLSIALRIFEQELRRADQWLQGRLDEGVPYRGELHLDPETQAAARGAIAAALEGIVELARDLGLEQREENLRAAIATAMSLSWANLCDARSDKLRRYGEVNPQLEGVLDARIDRLAELALAIASLLSSSSGAEPR